MRSSNLIHDAQTDATATTPPDLDALRHPIIALHYFGVEPPRPRRHIGEVAAIVADLEQRRPRFTLPPARGLVVLDVAR